MNETEFLGLQIYLVLTERTRPATNLRLTTQLLRRPVHGKQHNQHKSLLNEEEEEEEIQTKWLIKLIIQVNCTSMALFKC